MTNPGRLWIELETDTAGPHGVARDGAGRSRRFSGWLELIALIESPSAERTQPSGGSSRDAEPPSMPDGYRSGERRRAES
jgi:hypothetical protein